MARGLENVAHAIAFARERFLNGEEPAGPIRDEIATSWQRSALSGADPDIATLPYTAEVDLGSRLARAAEPVLDRLAERLGDTNTAVLLADKDARILDRWVSDPDLLTMMDGSDSAPGFSLVEDACGTNGLGSVVEERRAMFVCGAEHFAERFINYACYGAPIVNPLTGRLEGAVTLVCDTRQASPLMMPFVQEMSGAIEERLCAMATQREQALLDGFVKAGHGARRPLIAVNEKTIITNPSASRLLEGAEHAVLWEYAAEAIAGRGGVEGIVRVSTGNEITAMFRPLLDGGEVLGAIGELDATPRTASDAAPSSTSAATAAVERLRDVTGGHSKPWLHTLDLAGRAARTGDPLLLVGEPGSGKLHLAQAIHGLEHGSAPPTVFDAALAPVDGVGIWLRRLRGALDAPGTMILRHLETLDQRTALALAGVLEHGGPSVARPRVIGLFTCPDVPSRHGRPTHLDGIAAAQITLPPLRERADDIPDLVRRIATAIGIPSIAISSDALQALMRSPWPGNIRQLVAAVRTAIGGRSSGTVALADLPGDVVEDRTTPMTRVERAEYQAIVHAMRLADGNKKVAAAELGIARSTLYRKLRSYGFDLDRATF